MSYEYSEDGLVEAATQEVLEDLGWTVEYAWQKESFSNLPDRSDGLLGRANKSEVVLVRYCLAAINKQKHDLEVRESDYVDLSNLDFDKLRIAFAKSKHKNAVVFNLQEAIEKKLEQMVSQNPIRLKFYEKYKEIIEAYNAGKDLKVVQEAFDNLNDFMGNELTPELKRAMREELDEETLAIYDLLKKPTL